MSHDLVSKAHPRHRRPCRPRYRPCHHRRSGVVLCHLWDHTLGNDPNLLSELRAPGANLAALGMIILAGAFRQGMQRLSAFLGATVFLAYAFGRIVSMILDGMPSSGLVQATLIELVIGGLCAALLWRGRSRITANGPLLGLPG